MPRFICTVYFSSVQPLPLSPERAGKVRHLLSVFNFHEKRASWEGAPLKCSALTGNESQEANPTPDTGLPLPGDGQEEKPSLKGESNWLEIRVEKK